MLKRGYRHLHNGRFSEAGRIYLVTTVTRERRRVFRDFYAGRILVGALRAEERAGHLDSLAYVVMPDHEQVASKLPPARKTCYDAVAAST